METIELNQKLQPVCLLHRIQRTVTVLLAITCLPITMLAVFAAEGQEGAQGNDIQSRGLKDIQMPTWPQKWVVNNREPSGFGFGVTQPGPVIVDVQSQGAPIAVELYGAGPQAVQRQTGTGAIRLSYQVTSADIQRSALWHVRIFLAQAGGQPAQATGTIAVQHPPVDHNIVRTQIQARRAEKSVPNQESAARARKELDAIFQAHKAQFEQEKAARRAALEAKAQSQFNATLAQPKAGVQSRGLEAGGAVAEEAPVPAEGDVASRGLSSGTIFATKPQIQFAIPPPAITSLSMTVGEVGDPITINGTGFGVPQGGVLGEVHFVVAGRDLVATVSYTNWVDTQIKTSIPRECITAPVTGSIYVVRRSDGQKSATIPFTYMPEIGFANLLPPPAPIDSLVSYPGLSISGLPPGWYCLSYDTGRDCGVSVALAGLFGYKGNDQFYMNKRLKNGWYVAFVVVHMVGQTYEVKPWWEITTEGVYLADSRIGTDSPYVNVRVWEQPFVSTSYEVGIGIKGPQCLPFE